MRKKQSSPVALAAAVAGVYVLGEVELVGQPLGLAFAFANAVLFALYIVLAHRVSREPRLGGIDGLAAAMVVALAIVTPIGGWTVLHALLNPVAIGAGIGIGISSSVIPYVCDQLAMRKLPRAGYALAVSILPATATVIGLVVLGQIPTARDVLGIALVVAGVAGSDSTREGGRRGRAQPADALADRRVRREQRREPDPG